ncbi:MAG: COX15/CtaA family protein [Akkermansiaceae bacterium]
MTRFQKVAVAACVSLALLIMVGAIVRASGAGMGCPDWPTCWGKLIPPTSADQIDPAKLDIEKYRRAAERHGIDPETITLESVIESFNPVHTWTEYINRLTSTPLALFCLIAFVASFWYIRKRPQVFVASIIALILLGVNAWMGMQIVASGLKPGVITLHMALAIIMLCVLVYMAWRGCDSPWKLAATARQGGLYRLALILFVLIIVEGVLGSQIREKTDELKKTHPDEPRIEWVGELEKSPSYYIHRSGSWLILLGAGMFYLKAKQNKTGACILEAVVLGTVLAQMCLGLILAQVGILPFAQVLHIALSSLLVSALFLWLLAASRYRRAGPH